MLPTLTLALAASFAAETADPDWTLEANLESKWLGYEATVLEDPSREGIIRAFNKIALEADANDSVIIYYAGHGVVIPVNGVDTGFWLPSDTNAEEPGSWLSNADIARMVAAVGNRVEGLHRCQFGALTLPCDLAPGQWQWLSGANDIVPG